MRKLLEELVQGELGRRLVSTEPLTGGAVGTVFRAELEGPGPRSVCVKLMQNSDAPPFSEEPLERRVYGSRPANYDGARALLETVVPVPKLFAHKVVTDGSGVRWRCWIMEYIEGVALSFDAAARDDAAGMARVAGETVARLHQMERAYPGWVALPEAERWAWGPALFHTLRNGMREAAAAGMFGDEELDALYAFAKTEESRWTEPAAFSFGHPDGLQGLFQQEALGWRFRGVIDLEDHMYTDSRFPLAGLDLAARLVGIALPAALREGYESVRSWPTDFARARPVYQVLFLCTWSRVANMPHLAKLAHEMARSAA